MYGDVVRAANEAGGIHAWLFHLILRDQVRYVAASLTKMLEAASDVAQTCRWRKEKKKKTRLSR